MNIEYLNEFILLSESSSYQQAADMLFLSQATLTRHIQALEKELNTELFDRSARSNKLTEAGRIFLASAYTIVDSYSSAKDLISNHNQKIKGNLSIAIPFYCRYYGITDIVVGFIKSYPNIHVTLLERVSHSTRDALSRQVISFGFYTELGETPNFAFQTISLGTDTISLCIPENHPLAKEDVVMLKMLQGETFAVPVNTSPVYSNYMLACAEAGIVPKISYTVSVPNIYDLVREGLCIAFVPKKPGLGAHPEHTVIRDLDVHVTIHINMAYPNHELSIPEQLFLDYVQKYIKEHPDMFH